MNLYLTHRYVQPSRPERKEVSARVDNLGTVLLGLTLAAYALAMTVGRGRFDVGNIVLLLAAGLGAALFVRAEARTASRLVDLRIFRNPARSASPPRARWSRP